MKSHLQSYRLFSISLMLWMLSASMSRATDIAWLQMPPTAYGSTPPSGSTFTLPGLPGGPNNVTVTYSAPATMNTFRTLSPPFNSGTAGSVQWNNFEYFGTIPISGAQMQPWSVTYTFSAPVPANKLYFAALGLGRVETFTTKVDVDHHGNLLGEFNPTNNCGPTQVTPTGSGFQLQNTTNGLFTSGPNWNTQMAVFQITDPNITSLTVRGDQIRGDGMGINIGAPSDPEIAVFDHAGTNPADERQDNVGCVDFGTVVVGGSPTFTFTIQNTGTASLGPLSVSVSGAQSGGFITSAVTPTTTLAPGGTATFTVTFTPTTPGLWNATVLIASNDADENPFEINVCGNAIERTPDIIVDEDGVPLGNIAAWGDNEFNQCDLPKGIMAKAIAGSHGHSLIVKTDGTVIEVGRLQANIAYPGSGDTYTPMPLGLSNVVAVSSEYGRNVALDNLGQITIWGVDVVMPTFPSGTVIKAIVSGRYHSVALDTSGKVHAWSSGFPGRGDSDTDLIPFVPGPVPSDWVTTPNSYWTGVAAISAISGHTVALKTDGTVLCAGYNNQGETVVPSPYNAANSVVAPVVPGTYQTSIAAGVSKTVVRKANGDFDTWGLGDAWDTNSPFVPPPPAATDIIAVAAGIEHYLALHSDGTVDAWGYNSWKQTTNTGTGGSQGGSYAYLSHPLADVKAIACGEKHNLALTNSAHSYFRLISPTTTSTAKTYTIRNPGHASLTVTSVAIVGPANGFSVSTTGMAASIPAGGSTKFKVTFTQPASGPHDAKLRITTNDPDLPQFDITLYGTAPGFPIIKTQPVGKTVTAGSPVTFSVAAVGTGLTYDWQKGGVSLGAPNSPTFTIPSTSVSSRGSYSVVVSNSIGTLVSNFVPLIVNAPIVITAPVSPDIRYIGDSTTFSVDNTGTNVAYQWYKGSAAISGATGPSLTLSNLKATDAAIYKVKLSNTLTTLYSSASLVVVDSGSYAQDVADGSNALLTARAYGTPTSHAWSFSAAPASNPAKYLNPSGHVLTVKTAVDPTDEGPYTCVITNGSAGSLTTGPINLRVLIKPVVNPLTLPPSIMVSELVKIPVSATNNPTSFAISGLPKGLSYDKTTGLISGHALVSGSFTIKVTATNLDGTSPVVQGTLTVTALVGSATGTYEGPVQRHPVLGSNFGGRIRITVSSAGVISGTLYLGKATHSLVGALNITPTGVPVLSDIFIDRKAPDNDLHLTYLIDTATRSLTGTLEDGHLAGTSFLPDFSNTPFTGALITNTPALYAGNYTLAASHSVGGDDKPQGYSYASFKVSTGAIVSGAFKLADSTSITFSGSVDQSGSFPVFNLLYTNTGSFQGQVNIDTAQNNRLNASALTWNKNPQTGSTRYFKSGFGPLILSTIGRKYTSPASGALALGLTPGAGNAKLVFTDGLAPSPTTRWNVPALEIKAISPLVTLPANVIAAPTVGSHVQLSTLSIVPGVGSSFTVGTTALVKGKFSLKDLNPLNTAQTITRTNAFEALIVDDGPSQKAYGYFLLEELPAITGDTPTNTKYHGGKVVLSATP